MNNLLRGPTCGSYQMLHSVHLSVRPSQTMTKMTTGPFQTWSNTFHHENSVIICNLKLSGRATCRSEQNRIPCFIMHLITLYNAVYAVKSPPVSHTPILSKNERLNAF